VNDVDIAAAKLSGNYSEPQPENVQESPPEGLTVDEGAEKIKEIFGRSEPVAQTPEPEPVETPPASYRPHPERDTWTREAHDVVATANALAQAYESVDWATLKLTNPAVAQAKETQFREAKAELDQRFQRVRQAEQQIIAAEQNDVQEQHQKFLKHEANIVSRAGIDLKKEKDAIVRFLRSQGYSDAQISQARARDIILAHRAMTTSEGTGGLKDKLARNREAKRLKAETPHERYGRENAKRFPHSVDAAAYKLSKLMRG